MVCIFKDSGRVGKGFLTFAWPNILALLKSVSVFLGGYIRGRYHQEPSSQLITLKSQIFPVKNSNLQVSGFVALVAKSSVFETRQFWKASVFTFKILIVLHSSLFTRANLQTSQKPGYPPKDWYMNWNAISQYHGNGNLLIRVQYIWQPIDVTSLSF